MGNIHPARVERPELNEREITCITLHTHFTRKQINDIYIRFLSNYPRGYVNFDEFCKLYSSELKHLHNSQPLLQRLFYHIDTDKNDQLNFKEILFFKAISMPETDIDEIFRWIFILYDANQDDEIDENEFINLCYLAYDIHGKILTKNQLNQFKNLFQKFDFNNNQKLNCQEFIQLCKQSNDLFKLITPMFNNIKLNSKKDYFPMTNDLTSERIEYLIKRTKFSREQIIDSYQIFSKRCQSNRLTIKEFINFYKKFFQSNTSETYCEFIFQAFDHLSKDGFIQFDEYIIAIYIHSNLSTGKEKLEWLFHAYDRNNDGFINYNEINQIVHALFILYDIDREKHSVAYIAYEIMACLDLNNDDKISKQEFINVIKDKELTEFLAPSLVKQK